MATLKEVCSDKTSLVNYLAQKGSNHVRYRTYTKMDYVNTAIDSSAIYLSSGSTWNDTADRVRMRDETIFARCFAYGTEENIAMWMLYSGEENGGMLDFSQRQIHRMIAERKFDLGRYNKTCKHGFEVIVSDVEIPAENIQMKDVLYYSVNLPNSDDMTNNTIRITRGEEHATVDKSYLDDERIVMKTYPWHYEKEVRLQITVPEKYRKAIREEGAVVLRMRSSIEFDNLLKTKSENGLRSELECYMDPQYNGEQRIYMRESELYGQVKWKVKN